jgi:RNA polymerase sigma-70 factor (ECF subfamily)
MHDDPATRYTLIARLCDPEDSVAWGEFVAIYEPLIHRLGRIKGLQDADARDLAQEVFQAVARAIEGWEPGRGSFRGWISRIARNLLVNFLTRRRYRSIGSGGTSLRDFLAAVPSADPSATALFEAERERRLFEWAAEDIRGEFAPATWQAFWRTAVEGARPADVAAALGLSVGAVYIARSRVLSRLKGRVRQLSEDGGDLPGEAQDEATA